MDIGMSCSRQTPRLFSCAQFHLLCAWPRRPAAATTAWPDLDEIVSQSVKDAARIKQNCYASLLDTAVGARVADHGINWCHKTTLFGQFPGRRSAWTRLQPAHRQAKA